MAGMKRITIPDEEKAVLRNLRIMPIDEFEAFYARISEAEPTLDSDDFASGSLLNDVDKRLTGIVQMSVHAARTVFAYRVSLDEVLDALLELSEDDSSFSDGDEEVELRRRLLALLSLNSIQLTASAQAHLTSHPYIYSSAQIFSDLRSVFSAPAIGVPVSPMASVLIHQLQIRVRHNRRDEEFFIALDDSDLLQMKQAVEEALLRSDSIRAMEKNTGRLLITG